MPQPPAPTPAVPPAIDPAPAVAEVEAAAQAARSAQTAAEDAARTVVRDVVARTEKLDQIAVTAPRSAREMEGLNVRRDLLRQQLERAEERRGELTRELQRVGESEEGRAADPGTLTTLRAGLELRLREADARVLQLERDIAGTERALTGAGPEVLAQYEQQRPREPVRSGPDEDDVVGGVFGGFVVGVLLMVVARRIRAWRRRRRGEAPFGEQRPAGVGPDPRIDRLTQAVDAIAVEVERIGEGQRFVTQLMAERRELVPAELGRTAEVPGTR